MARDTKLEASVRACLKQKLTEIVEKKIQVSKLLLHADNPLEATFELKQFC
jgi:hypothetical protein